MATSGLKFRVVLWPQSTKTFAGPPDSAMWWSGGLLENSQLKKKREKINGHRSFVGLCLHIFFIKYHVLQGLFKSFVQEKVNSVSCV